MTDLIEVGRVLRLATFAADETSEVALARRFFQDLDLYRIHNGQEPVSPVVTRGAVYWYDDGTGVWQEIGFEDVKRLVACYDGCLITSTDQKGFTRTKPLTMSATKVAGVARCVIGDLDRHRPDFFDAQPAGVAFRNGFVTVSATGLEFSPRSPDHRVLVCQPFDYDPDSSCPHWLAMLRKVFGGGSEGTAKGDLLQEFVGAALAGVATHYAKCLVMIGEGANGKSVVAETIAEQLFPPSAVTYSAPQTWSGRFSTARLRNSRLNVASELPDADIQASDIFKSVVDGGCIEVEQKNRDPFSIKPRAGHVFLTNAPPSTRDNSKGFWRRFLILHFEHDFTKDADAETKETVKARLASEAPGIMLWALHGAARLVRRGEYTIPRSHTDMLDEIRKETDSVAAFLEECCEKRDGTKTKSSVVYASFCEWADRAGRRRISNRAMTRRLMALGVEREKTMHGRFLYVSVLPQAQWEEGKTPRLELVL